MKSLYWLLLSCCSMAVSSIHLRREKATLGLGGKPTDGEWRRGEKGATCADTCGVLTCDPDKPASLTSQEKVADAFKKTGYTCKGFGGHRDYAGAPLSTGRAGRDCYWFSPHDGSKSSTCFSNKYSSNAPLCFCRPNALQIQFDHLEAEVEQLKNLIENWGTNGTDGGIDTPPCRARMYTRVNYKRCGCHPMDCAVFGSGSGCCGGGDGFCGEFSPSGQDDDAWMSLEGTACQNGVDFIRLSPGCGMEVEARGQRFTYETSMPMARAESCGQEYSDIVTPGLDSVDHIRVFRLSPTTP